MKNKNINKFVLFIILLSSYIVNCQTPYAPNSEYTFEYKYIKKDTDEPINYVFVEPFYGNGSNDRSEDHAWYFSKYFDNNTVKHVKIKVSTGQINGTQTPMTFEFLNDNNRKIVEAATGLISNKDKVWLHPPRTKGFGILEVTPFPYYMTNKKEWKQTITVGGERWGSKKWKEWKGNIDFVNTYAKKGTVTIKSNLGSIECEKIIANGKSKLGETTLTAFYNSNYGFVKLNYKLINGDTLEMSLIKVD